MRVRVPQEMSTANRKKYNDFRDNMQQTDSKQYWQDYHNFTFRQANAKTIDTHNNSPYGTVSNLPAPNQSLFSFPDNVDQ
jgi:hypothetical protein